jgi:rhamnosyltransferase subunit B
MNTRSSRRIVVTTFGSFGDIHPYIPLTLELKARGHRPVFATLPFYREKIENLGLEFYGVRPDLGHPSENREILEKAMDKKKGTEFIFKELLMPSLRQSYDDLLEITREADLLITHPITLAGPIIAEQFKVPWVSTVLSPASFFSIFDPPETPAGAFINSLMKLHPAIARSLFGLVKLQLKSWIKPFYQLRSELGLPNGKHPIFEGQHSPEMVLALFSKVLAEPQLDWPANTHTVGFPFYDKNDSSGRSAELSAFLDAGPAPIVFTLGSSAVWTAGDFYHQSVATAIELGQRAVLLKGDQELDLPALPDSILAVDYAPYGEILPRARAVVHQGGIGTTAQALRAGVPMLVVPFSHDQPDNAARITRLGVGRTIERKHYNSETAARELRTLMEESSYAQRATEVARAVRSENAATTAVDLIETKFFQREN